jgi:hypothetical protein
VRCVSKPQVTGVRRVGWCRLVTACPRVPAVFSRGARAVGSESTQPQSVSTAAMQPADLGIERRAVGREEGVEAVDAPAGLPTHEHH